ncbi:ABC transporter ATP-binding protein [Alloiococcus otitis]|uniref:ABC transporter ATP-binding protein n=1 Tax=Alloiococcus otitis TaxID=1652 RepID=UPI002357E2B6|nr:ABC transporter ATP-binding protein [Alloiococcus otitis]
MNNKISNLDFLKFSLSLVHNKFKLFISIFLSLVSAILTLIIPYIIGLVFNPEIIALLNIKPSILICSLLVIAFIFIIHSLSTYSLGSIGIDTLTKLQANFFKHSLKLPITQIYSLKTGDINSRIMNDLASIAQFFSVLMPQLIVNSFIVIGSIVLLILINWQLTFIVLSILPIFILIQIPLNIKLEKLSCDSSLKNGENSAYIFQRLTNIKLVKSKMTENYEGVISYYRFKNHGKTMKKLLALETVSLTVGAILLFAYLFFVFYYSFNLYMTSNLSIPKLVSFFLYVLTTVSPLLDIVNIISQISETKGNISRILQIMNLHVEENNGSNTIPKIESITARKLNFSYGNEKTILHEVDFEINRPSLVAFVGPSGVGKTTLLELIMKFHANYGGSLKINGVELSKLKLSNIRNNIEYINQYQELFEGTIRDNLIYGYEGSVEDNKIYNILELVNANEFVSAMPKGLDSYVSESANNLSAGQKQRLNIARSLLNDPDVLLFDEPTSNLDGLSKKIIYNLLKYLSKIYIVIVVSHEIEAIKDANKIYVLEKDGRIINSGTHNELFNNSETYQNLYYHNIEK